MTSFLLDQSSFGVQFDAVIHHESDLFELPTTYQYGQTDSKRQTDTQTQTFSCETDHSINLPFRCHDVKNETKLNVFTDVLSLRSDKNINVDWPSAARVF